MVNWICEKSYKGDTIFFFAKTIYNNRVEYNNITYDMSISDSSLNTAIKKFIGHKKQLFNGLYTPKTQSYYNHQILIFNLVDLNFF
jgi:hypothetical protein